MFNDSLAEKPVCHADQANLAQEKNELKEAVQSENEVLARTSFSSMSGVVETLSVGGSRALYARTLSILSNPPLALPLSPLYRPEHEHLALPHSPADDSTPRLPKRAHALLEFLSSERAYATDLAIMRDIHIPMASGAFSL